MKKKVIIFHLAHFDQKVGGAEKQLKYISEFLDERDLDVHYVYLNRGAKKVAEKNISLHPIYYNPVTKSRFGKLWFLYFFNIKALILRLKPNLIITRTNSSWAGICSIFAKKYSIIHYHFIAHDDDVNLKTASIPKFKIFDRIEKKITSEVFNNDSKIITQNEYQKKQLKLNYGVSSKKFTQAIKLSNKKISKDSEKINIVWIGNLKPKKNPNEFFKLVDFYKNNKLLYFNLIGGDKENIYTKKIKKLSKLENFKYFGELSNYEVTSILSKSFILISTSLSEGFSNTFLEAMSLKNIVISYNSNPDKILTKNKIGYLSNNFKHTISIIDKLLNERHLLMNMTEGAYNYVLEKHNLEKIYSKIFKGILIR